MIQFYITVISGKAYRLKVNLKMLTDEIEIYQVRAKNKTFSVESNRPMLRGKGLKNFPPKWKINAGAVSNQHFLEKVFEAIMEVVDKPDI